ncbi:MAG: thioredoxin family protein [Thermoanaerobaculia bacterium]
MTTHHMLSWRSRLGAMAVLAAVLAAPLAAQLSVPEKAEVSVATDRTAYAPGESARLLVELAIEDGWHVNANPATFDYLIPTSASARVPEGWPAAESEYPPGVMRTFAFADEPLSVYEGTVTLALRTAVPAGAADGDVEIPVTVTYQACDHQRCLPPITKNYPVALTVGPDGEPTAAGLAYSDAAPPAAAATTSPAPGFRGFAVMLLLGMVGGLILNVMPCVLPVLSLKLMGLVKGAGQGRREVAAGALMTSLGILASFWALAGVAIAARAAGAAVGWGVQFQEPIFVAVLAVVVTFFCLNLWGVFEIGLPRWLARSSAGAGSTGLTGHFGAGLFTTVMATPCSAPFLGTAVAFALTQPAGTVVAVATAIGAGMALPYLLLALAPGSVRWLPRPGAWMSHLKVVMGFLLAATDVWLLYVLAGQVDRAAVAWLQLGLLALALALWVRHRLGAPVARWLGVAGAAAAVVLTLGVAATAPASGEGDGIDWVDFDRGEAERLAATGQLVFVDVTADWCVTCKFNERLVLETEEIAELFERHDVVAMKADWTNRSRPIAQFLADHGRYGIPFYLLYRPHQEPHVFSELITRQAVTEAVQQAAPVAQRPSTP